MFSIFKAKKETNFFIQNVEKHQEFQKAEIKRKKRKKDSEEDSANADVGQKDSKKGFKYRQRDTDEEILSRKRKLKDNNGPTKGKKSKLSKFQESTEKSDSTSKRAADNKMFLMNLFSGGVSSQDTDTSSHGVTVTQTFGQYT